MTMQETCSWAAARRMLLLVALSVLALVGAACGGGSSGPSVAPGPPGGQAATPSVTDPTAATTPTLSAPQPPTPPYTAGQAQHLLSIGWMMNAALSSTGATFWTGAGGELNEFEEANGESPIVAVAVGGSPHFCTLRAGGEVQCAGNNDAGQLGDGTRTGRFDGFVNTVGLDPDIVAIAAGRAHTCALTKSGRVQCWGLNDAGQLGNGTTSNSAEPVDVTGVPAVTGISSWNDHTCAVAATGQVWCWGDNEAGQLGDGTKSDSAVPVQVTGLAEAATSVAAGMGHTCAITHPGAVWCWGRDDYAQLGRVGNELEGYPEPVPVNQLQEGVVGLAIGGLHSCALTEAGKVLCWGSNTAGQLGIGSGDTFLVNTPDPTDVVGLAGGVSAIAAGMSHTCALGESGSVTCWGAKTYDEDFQAKAFYKGPQVVIGPDMGKVRLKSVARDEVLDVAVGDCFAETQQRVPCSSLHSREVFAIGKIIAKELPDETDLEPAADAFCAAGIRTYLKDAPATLPDEWATSWPSEESWGYGHRTITCEVSDDPAARGSIKNR